MFLLLLAFRLSNFSLLFWIHCNGLTLLPDEATSISLSKADVSSDSCDFYYFFLILIHVMISLNIWNYFQICDLIAQRDDVSSKWVLYCKGEAKLLSSISQFFIHTFISFNKWKYFNLFFFWFITTAFNYFPFLFSILMFYVS